METTSLLLPPSQRAKLLSAGYTTVHSLCNVSHIDLSRDVGISSEEALEILQIAWNSTGATSSSNTGILLTGARTAWDLLHQETSRKRIVTFCDELDRILGGGIGPKEVTELDGVPGIGKTQIGIQLAVNVQIPAEFGGLEGQAVYIDTEGSFMVERVCQIAEACVKKLEAFPSRSETRAMKDNRKLHIDDILENIFFFRVCSSTEQIALVNYLDKFIEEHKKVKIVIVDSVTFHFRQDFDDLALRTRLLGVMAQKLMGLAEKYDTAVVLMNQVTTKFSGSSVQLAPALGEAWSHSCTNRVILYWSGHNRLAYIDKSPSLQSASAPFSISEAGICNPDNH